MLLKTKSRKTVRMIVTCHNESKWTDWSVYVHKLDHSWEHSLCLFTFCYFRIVREILLIPTRLWGNFSGSCRKTNTDPRFRCSPWGQLSAWSILEVLHKNNSVNGRVQGWISIPLWMVSFDYSLGLLILSLSPRAFITLGHTKYSI